MNVTVATTQARLIYFDDTTQLKDLFDTMFLDRPESSVSAFIGKDATKFLTLRDRRVNFMEISADSWRDMFVSSLVGPEWGSNVVFLLSPQFSTPT